mmetsp:Transcript_18000/g.37335  ORF Transcript_18000/g.37335 Transcript_18000/m.37335 type:complete len:204 (-) Transcript_18000:1441-2052(-)
MGRARRTRKFAEVKRVLSNRDSRLKVKEMSKQDNAPLVNKEKDAAKANAIASGAVPTSMFFSYNTALGPPFHVLLDTNFINFSVTSKLDISRALLDCLYAPAVACITDCVMGELQKLGPKYKIALRAARDKSFLRLMCTHKGTYADDCLVERVQQHRVYIVGTCDKDLKRRIRKIPGVPIMTVLSSRRQYTIERLPDAFMAPR